MNHPGDWSWRHNSQYFLLRWPEPRPCLSSAVLNGGLCQAQQLLNLRVDGKPYECSPEASLQEYADTLQCRGSTVGMMTAASMNSLRERHATLNGEPLSVYVSCGLDNARRAGDAADWQEVNPLPVGTINIVLITSMTLSTATQAEVMMLLTEAKSAALQNLQIKSPVSGHIATGTGTDSCAVIGGFGRDQRWFGKHTDVGEQVARMLIAALTDSIQRREANQFDPK